MDRGQMNPIRDQAANLSSMNPLYQFMADQDALLGMGMQQQLPSASIQHMDWSPDTMLDNLTFIEEKIRQVKDVIRAMAGLRASGSATPAGELSQAQQQQLVNADLTCLIVQLISTAGSLLPSLKNSSFLSRTPPPPAGGAGQAVNLAAGESSSSVRNEVNKEEEMGSPDYEELFKGWTNGGAMDECIGDGGVLAAREEQDVKVDAGGGVGEDPPPAPETYQVLQLEEDEILAPHTHFCSICGKGFKRDANLRMHMRGHGDEYKSAAALAKPPAAAGGEEEQPERRYSCPFVGCKRNRMHASFQPLKTILCVKNHYKRSHCEKRHTCGRCGAKKFSVMADLKTHEKHCGRDRWLCSCGTSFSRKDKLFAHVALFQGHAPALPPPTQEATATSSMAPAPAPSARRHKQEPAGASSFTWGGASTSCDDGDALLDVKGIAGAGVGSGGDDFFAAANFGSIDFSFGQLDAFPGDSSLAMLLPSEQFTGDQEENGEK